MLAGCTSVVDGFQADDSPIEQSGVELARVDGERMESYFGVSAIVYNHTSEAHSITVRFTIYDSNGKQVRQGVDTVPVPAMEERHVSKYWKSGFDESEYNLPVNSWDAEITKVE